MSKDIIIKNKYEDYKSALAHMEQQGVKHLGWLNSGIQLPQPFESTNVYSNWTGTSTLCVDKIRRECYSVDMGD